MAPGVGLPPPGDSLGSVGPCICPVCKGKGLVAHDFYGNGSTDNAPTGLPRTCLACTGRGVVWR